MSPAEQKTMTLEQFRALQSEHEGAFLRKNLIACDWMLVPTAERLGTSPSNIRRLLKDHPKIDAERIFRRREAGPGAKGGRPVGT